MREINLQQNDQNYPVYKRITACSASTTSDGLTPYGTTIQSIDPKIYQDDFTKQFTTQFNVNVSLTSNLAQFFISGSSTIPKGIYTLSANLTYVQGIYTIIDSFVDMAIINFK